MSSPRKKLVLHIGTHKTATTHLQGTLARNAQLLGERGLLYPKAGQIHNAHFKLTQALRDRARADIGLEELSPWPELMEEVQAAPQPLAVVSSEEFSLATDPARLAPLREKFDVLVVVYLRSPDQFVQSFYNQFVKDEVPAETRTLTRYVAEETLFFLETRRILLPWAETFGPANVCLRIFDAVARSRRGIVGDFFEAIGFVPPERLAPPEISVLHKVSLPPDALEFLRLTNGTAELKDGGRYQFVVDLVDMALKEKDRLHTTRAGILSAPSRMALRRRFAAPNAWAARTFLGVSQNPFPPHEAPPPPPDFDSRPEEADAATLARVAAMVLSRLRNPAAG